MPHRNWSCRVFGEDFAIPRGVFVTYSDLTRGCDPIVASVSV